MTTASAAPVVACAGVPITATTRQEAAALVVELAAAPRSPGTAVHLCNAYTLALADSDPSLRALLDRDSTLSFADGMSVVWANRWRHKDLDLPRERVYGPDLFLDVVERGQDAGLRHYLLGSTPAVLADLQRELTRRFPDAEIVGAESPPFRPMTGEERAEQRRRLVDSGAQVVWLGLGTPQQDVEAARLAAELPMVFVAVGAAFDFVAGHKKQAPAWMQQRGLEWLFRLSTEPRRLWKRYVFGNARFVIAATRRQ